MTHPAVEAAFEAISQSGAKDDGERLIAAKCRALAVGQHKRWGEPEFEVLGVEELVQSDLYNPDTQARSRTFSIAGKLDLIANRRGRRVIFDHKSTSEDIKDPASPYWSQLVIEAQPSHYSLLCWLNGNKVDEVVWNVLRKPDIKPRQVPKKEREAVCADRVYFGAPVSECAVDELMSTERESLELYEYRLAYDCTVERPDHYFQRRTVARLDSDIAEHAGEVWSNSKSIMFQRAVVRDGKLPVKHSSSCMNFGRACRFLGICSGHDSADSDQWRAKNNVHSELSELTGDGRDVLTNSRIKCFQSCPRKHYYSYELGIERVREETSEALAFGTLWHKCLEAYYRWFMQEQAVAA